MELSSASAQNSQEEESEGTDFARRTDFRWFAMGISIFLFILLVLPMPGSMLHKASAIYSGLTPGAQAGTSVDTIATHIKVVISLLAMCVVFFATEAVSLPGVALSIGLIQLFFVTTPPMRIVQTYAHDAVWFIAGSLALGATLVKYGLDKRIGMLVMKWSGTSVRRIIIGIIIGTAFPAAFIGEHAVAGMYLPLAIALYTLTNKKKHYLHDCFLLDKKFMKIILMPPGISVI